MRPIKHALMEARKNNVLLFAATGNEGGNQAAFWPSTLLDVIPM